MAASTQASRPTGTAAANTRRSASPARRGAPARCSASRDRGGAPLPPPRAPSRRREGLAEIDALAVDQVAREFIEPDAEPARAVAVMDDPLGPPKAARAAAADRLDAGTAAF